MEREVELLQFLGREKILLKELENVLLLFLWAPNGGYFK